MPHPNEIPFVAEGETLNSEKYRDILDFLYSCNMQQRLKYIEALDIQMARQIEEFVNAN